MTSKKGPSLEPYLGFGFLGFGLFALAATGLYHCNTQRTNQPVKTTQQLSTPQQPYHPSTKHKPTIKNDLIRKPQEPQLFEKRIKTLPGDLDHVLRTYLADELNHYEDWDTKKSFLRQYEEPVLKKVRTFTAKDITTYLDTNQQVKTDAEKLFGNEIATLYSSTPNNSLGDLIAKEGGLNTNLDVLSDRLWEQTRGLWQEKGKRDLLQRMFLDQDVTETLTNSLGGKQGIAEFYNTIVQTYLKPKGVLIPPTFLQDLSTYYSNTEQTEEQQNKLFDRINGVFIQHRISYETLGSRVLEVLKKESRWDALGAYILHHKNPKAFQLEKKKKN